VVEKLVYPPLPKYFNTAGPCLPGRHYLLPPLPRVPAAQARHQAYGIVATAFIEKLRQVATAGHPAGMTSQETTGLFLDMVFTYHLGWFNLGHALGQVSAAGFDFAGVDVGAALNAATNPYYRVVAGIDFTGAVNFDPGSLAGLTTYGVVLP
jgi:hypothetical protein